jgi:pyridoxine/pyridoxamine 5'-phosphate oxidase
MNPNENLNDVNEILESINRVLSRGVKDRHSDYHTFSVATSDDNLVNNRTVVLREFNHDKKYLCYHTNFSSEKISELKKNNNIACLF